MTIASREFEELVTRIEAAVAPIGAIVKSPDRIKPKHGRRAREIDASIRYKVGSAEVLVTVECRERSRQADVTWIEQLATKRSLIGASLTIAVSSRGFSDDAVAVAKQHDIQLRLIQEITNQEIIDWANGLQVMGVATNIKLCRMLLEYAEPSNSPPQLSSEINDLWTKEGYTARIFRDMKSGSMISLKDVVYRTDNAPVGHLVPGRRDRYTIPPKSAICVFTRPVDPLVALLRDLPTDGTKINTWATVTTTGGEYAIGTTTGEKTLSRIHFEIEAFATSERIPVARILHYADEVGPVAKVTEHQIALGPPTSAATVVVTRYEDVPRETKPAKSPSSKTKRRAARGKK
jgi:hypothetical protein